jgi:hypothetical protein
VLMVDLPVVEREEEKMTNPATATAAMVGCTGLGILLGAALRDGNMMSPKMIILVGAAVAVIGWVLTDVFIIDGRRAELGERDCRRPDIRS